MSDSPSNIQSAETSHNKRERRRVVVWLLGALVLMLLGGIVAQQLFLWSVVPGPERAIEALVLLALSSVILLLFVIIAFVLVRNLLKLRRERGENRFGSRLKTRLVTYFIALSLLPITVMALFSYTFLNRSLEKWFGSFPQDIVVEAKRAQDADAERSRADLEATANLVGDAVLSNLSRHMTSGDVSFELAQIFAPSLDMNDLARRANLDVVVVASRDERLVARGMAANSQLISSLADRLATLDTPPQTLTINGSTFDIVRVPINGAPENLPLFVVAAHQREANERLGALVQASEKFEQLRSSQRWVRGLGLTTLALLTLLILFALTWTANHLARSIVMPLGKLAEASAEVARGNLSHRVSEIADDELATLAASFNSMTGELEENRSRIEAGARELGEKNRALDERRSYIETILASLSAGVISLDDRDRVTTINRVARTMLQPAWEAHAGEAEGRLPVELNEVACTEDAAILDRVARRARRAGRATEQTSLVRGNNADGGTVHGEQDQAVAAMPVALTATALQSPGVEEEAHESRGVVIVMEDLTDLIAAQRAAAWSEVARRMAHEIKNPLTPIQLSAERIARHFERALSDDNGETENLDAPLDVPVRSFDEARLRRVVEDGTGTITREVASLKSMVDEFSRFAQLPSPQLAPCDLNTSVRQAIALYEERFDNLRIEARLADQLPVALFDAEQMRRVFVNLLENAAEAVSAEKPNGGRRVTVATGFDARRGVLLAEVSDNGHGIKPSDYPRLFQPYFSTRNRGTGLGLAIVQRIITDHGGRIQVEPNYPRGARFRLELPVEERSEGVEGQKVASHKSQVASI